MLEKIKFPCGHEYPWVLEGKNGNCAYCDGEYPDGAKCAGGKKKEAICPKNENPPCAIGN